MQIRRAEAADEEALTSIRRGSILGLAAPAMSVEKAEEWANGAAADRITRAIREHDVWVAVEEVAIGWVEVDRDRLAALYVSPTFSRRGVGSNLLLKAETDIRSAGYAIVRLEAWRWPNTPPALGGQGRTMNATIRLAGLGDERILAELNASVQDLHMISNPAYFKPGAREEVTAWFQGLLEKPTVKIWIAEADGVPVDQIGVRPDWRRRGIGRALVQAVLGAASEKGIREVELEQRG